MLALVAVGTWSAGAAEQARDRLRVMSFNVWVGGEGSGRGQIDGLVEVVKASGADVVGVQEALGRQPKQGGPQANAAKAMAAKLGWHHVDLEARPPHNKGRAILSRFPIVAAAPRGLGAVVELSSGGRVTVLNVHLPAAPYEPYGLVGIPYDKTPKLATEAEAVASARTSRGAQVDDLVAAAKEAMVRGERILVTGDFNEPSHLDWTAAAAKAGRCPLPVAWPASRAMAGAGLADAYRALHGDPVKRPGLTWTPTMKDDDPKERHDRIDFVYAGPGVKVTRAKVVGEDEAHADVTVAPYPSDHRGVVVEVEVARAEGR